MKTHPNVPLMANETPTHYYIKLWLYLQNAIIINNKLVPMKYMRCEIWKHHQRTDIIAVDFNNVEHHVEIQNTNKATNDKSFINAINNKSIKWHVVKASLLNDNDLNYDDIDFYMQMELNSNNPWLTETYEQFIKK